MRTHRRTERANLPGGTTRSGIAPRAPSCAAVRFLDSAGAKAAGIGFLLAGLVVGGGCGSEPPPSVEVPALPTLRLAADGARLRDALGREVLLRGVNAGGRSKFPPFFPFPFAESGRPEQAGELPFARALDAYVARVADWGLDVVRLPFSWEALEPVRGTYDETYLDRYAAMAQAFGAQGIRVIVDFHQDVFARPFCGDGFPRWALPDPDVPDRESCTAWWTGYLGDPEVDRAFDRFWANEDGLRDAFEAMWRVVAARLWPVEGVIGFEPINEPHRGTADEAAWTRDVLEPFFARLAQVLREVAPGALVFVEPSGTDAADRATTFTPPVGEGFVFAPHYYNAAVYVLGPDAAAYDVVADLAPWAAWRDAHGVPLLLGEFGCRTGTEGGARYLGANFDALDSYLAHGTAWEYSTAADDWNDEGFRLTGPGGEETPSVGALVRVYPRAVAGTIASFRFDAAARRAELRFAARPGVTEIAVPARLYPEGVDMTVEGVDARWNDDPRRGLALVETRGPGTARVTIGPAAGRTGG